MTSQVNFRVSVQGLANTPMRYEIRYQSVPDGLSIVGQIFANMNTYLARGYGISLENLFVFVNVTSPEKGFPRQWNQVVYHPD